jgi:hypothetical protein
MMTIRDFFYGRRDRRIVALAVAAVLCIGLAFAALHHRAEVVAPKSAPEALFPGLAHAISGGQVTRIHIVSRGHGSFDIAFVPTKGWVLPQSGNYPASFEMVKQTLVAIAALQTIEPKTDRPELFHFIDLDAPPAGGGTSVTLIGEHGRVIAALIVGKSAQQGQDITVFVRRAGENQSWLARSPAEFKLTPADWMDKSVVAIDHSRIATIEVKPPTGPAYTAAHAKPADPLTLSPIPAGRELAFPGVADALASVLADFSFDDIKPATAFDFTTASRMSLTTFDGLTVTIDIVQKDGANWVRLLAIAAPGKPPAAREALAINARAAGWAFKLPVYRAAAFAPALETLLRPNGPAAVAPAN